MRYSVNKAVAQWRVVDDEAVVVNAETSFYYSLNRSGTVAWQAMAERPHTLDELAQAVARTFQIDEARARHDLTPLVAQLRDERLLTES